MTWHLIFAFLAWLSLALLVWQWTVARRFPLHRRVAEPGFFPAVTLLKPLKGCDAFTEDCLRSWFRQEYAGPVQLVFGVASSNDPVCALVRKLLEEFPQADARLVVCGPLAGANLKVSKLMELAQLARHEIWVISDADVRVPPDFLANVVVPLQAPEIGLVSCFYRLANPVNLAMHLEALTINADFWSQVLQAQSLKPLDFALGAVMATRRQLVEDSGGLPALKDCLADDYQLGHRIARRGHRISLCPVVVDCWDAPKGWREVWKHQLRWARTIRVCQPLPYFFSILNNPTLWLVLWAVITADTASFIFLGFCVVARAFMAIDLESRLSQSTLRWRYAWLAPIKDLLQTVIWALAFLGNRVEWRGERLRLKRDGTLVREK
jgi:ceramide glucosyltransferase